MNDLVPSQRLIEDLINNKEKQTKIVNDIQVRLQVLLVPQDIVVTNLQQIPSM